MAACLTPPLSNQLEASFACLVVNDFWHISRVNTGVYTLNKPQMPERKVANLIDLSVFEATFNMAKLGVKSRQ